MVKKIHLSVVLATYNEETNLPRCLASVKNLADEIVVVDGKSLDKTADIAKKFGARVIATTNKLNFHINKNIGLDAARGDWILQLDADEVIPPELAAEIKQILTTNNQQLATSPVGYWLNRKNWFLSRFLNKGGQYPDPTLRLYRRGLGRLPAADVHEQALVTGLTGHLKHDLLHYRDTDFEKYASGFDRYSSFIATQMADRKESLGIWPAFNYLFLKPLITFIRIYFGHKGFVDGFPGFVFALFSGLVHGVSYIKYWQATRYPA